MCATTAINTLTNAELDELCVNTIRTLSIDAVQAAKSGHPGTPMALAPLVYTIWNRVMNFDPPTRFGPTVIDLSSLMATPLCCSGLRSILRKHKPSTRNTNGSVNPLSRSMTSVGSANSIAEPQGTPNTTGFLEWKRQPVPSDTELPQASVWLLPKSGSRPITIGPSLKSSITAFLQFAETVV